MGQTESGWQLEASAPELYERYMVPAVARLWAADLVERAAPKRGERVLDVACLQDPFTRRSAHPPPMAIKWQPAPTPCAVRTPFGQAHRIARDRRALEGGFIEMVLHWQGGDHTALQLKINGSPARRVVHPCFRPTRGRGNKKIWNQPHALEPTLSKEIELGPESVGRQSIVKTTLVNEQADETAVISVISGYVAPSNSEWFS